MEQSPSWKVSSHSSSQGISLLLWNPRVHFLYPQDCWGLLSESKVGCLWASDWVRIKLLLTKELDGAVTLQGWCYYRRHNRDSESQPRGPLESRGLVCSRVQNYASLPINGATSTPLGGDPNHHGICASSNYKGRRAKRQYREIYWKGSAGYRVSS